MEQQIIDLGFRPRDWQAELYRLLRRFSVLIVHRRAGKTIMAIMRLIDAALRCNLELGHYAYIAPELKQAKAVIWDILKKYTFDIPGIEVNESELWVRFPHNRAKIRLFGADNINALRGMYFDGIVIDEVAQIDRRFWGMVLLPALTDRHKMNPAHGWALFIGTPQGENMLTEFYQKARAGNNTEWFSRLYTVYDTGVFTEEEILKIKRETPSEAEFRQEWLCDFDVGNNNALLGKEHVVAAMERHLREDEYNFAPRIIGVDVAWAGGDRSVIFKRQGLALFQPIVRKGLPEKQFAGTVAQEAYEWKADAIFIDVTGGYGGEVLSKLVDAGYNAVGIKFSEKPMNERFHNKRAEMWWSMADWVKGGGALWKDDMFSRELCAPNYSMDNASNKIKLESKEDIRERISFSPDIGDALALTFAFPVQPQMHVGPLARQHQADSDWDPYKD